MFVTFTVKVTGPPGSATCVGYADLSTWIVGRTSLICTVALPSSVAVLPSSSLAVPVTVSVLLSPPLPDTCALNEHEYVPPPAIGESATHVESLIWSFPASSSKSPYGTSISVLSVTGSTDVFFTVTVKVTRPPGSIDIRRVRRLVDLIVGRTSLTVTVASA